ncbi:hypothetical protein [Oceanobacillus senegalensis]|uniref:hypothetical protein n=1 Tax=Oceanobacillus senegalensis TaxID=1936063 RepID=UPI0015C43315|nr:hypothetical protein [Oceanobacillus senegalensis]
MLMWSLLIVNLIISVMLLTGFLNHIVLIFLVFLFILGEKIERVVKVKQPNRLFSILIALYSTILVIALFYEVYL